MRVSPMPELWLTCGGRKVISRIVLASMIVIVSFGCASTAPQAGELNVTLTNRTVESGGLRDLAVSRTANAIGVVTTRKVLFSGVSTRVALLKIPNCELLWRFESKSTFDDSAAAAFLPSGEALTV